MNTAIKQVATLSACPDKLIEALAINLVFEPNYEIACKNCDVINSNSFWISDDGSILYKQKINCDCEFDDCEHSKYAQEKQDELNDEFQRLCLLTCEFHHQQMQKEFSDDNGNLINDAIEKYIEKYLD